MIPSTTDRAHFYQHAVAERVNGIPRDESDLDAVFPTFADAQDPVASALHRDNTIRTHWSLEPQTLTRSSHRRPSRDRGYHRRIRILG